MVVWEWLKTVSLLKSELIKEIINPKKLMTTKKNWINVKVIIFLSKISASFKFFNVYWASTKFCNEYPAVIKSLILWS